MLISNDDTPYDTLAVVIKSHTASSAAPQLNNTAFEDLRKQGNHDCEICNVHYAGLSVDCCRYNSILLLISYADRYTQLSAARWILVSNPTNTWS